MKNTIFHSGLFFFHLCCWLSLKGKKREKHEKRRKKISFMVVLHGKKWVEKKSVFSDIPSECTWILCIFVFRYSTKKNLFISKQQQKYVYIDIYSYSRKKRKSERGKNFLLKTRARRELANEFLIRILCGCFVNFKLKWSEKEAKISCLVY